MIPFNPSNIYNRAKNICGFDELLTSMKSTCYSGEAISSALCEVCEDYSDWDSDQGFGSSDTTYAVMKFIQYLIQYSNLSTVYSVGFKPRLTVFKL